MRSWRMVGFATWLAMASVVAAQAPRSASAEEGMRNTLAQYERAINGMSLEGALNVYEPDGIFMPNNGPTVVGKAALREYYIANIFGNVESYALRFAPVEVISDGNWGFVRVATTGMVVGKADGRATPRNNRALFVLHKGSDGVWRVARYLFNANPPA
jgi:uncharacterized protein (TIGR02246 family)